MPTNLWEHQCEIENKIQNDVSCVGYFCSSLVLNRLSLACCDVTQKKVYSEGPAILPPMSAQNHNEEVRMINSRYI